MRGICRVLVVAEVVLPAVSCKADGSSREGDVRPAKSMTRRTFFPRPNVRFDWGDFEYAFIGAVSRSQRAGPSADRTTRGHDRRHFALARHGGDSKAAPSRQETHYLGGELVLPSLKTKRRSLPCAASSWWFPSRRPFLRAQTPCVIPCRSVGVREVFRAAIVAEGRNGGSGAGRGRGERWFSNGWKTASCSTPRLTICMC